MASFRKVNSKALLKPGVKLSDDEIFWKKYSAPVLVKEFGPIDYIDFSPVEPYYFAVTSSCKVQIYNPVTKVPVKILNRFKKCAYGGTFRKDGSLICSGSDEGEVKLFNVNTKSLLRVFHGHQAAVHRTFFTSDGLRIVSFSDDKSSALWDIATEKKIISFYEHNDYVRAGAINPTSPDVYVSGSYDKKINVYDTRTNKTIFSVSHDAPVESIVFLPSGGVFLSAGGSEVRVWDALNNGKLLAKISQHHKTITCLQVAYNGQRILSGSLDRHVNVYETGSYRTLHSFDYPNSILSVGLSNDCETIVSGMVDGMISISKRDENIKKEPLSNKKLSYTTAGENFHSSNVNIYVPEVTKTVMPKHDMYLRKFQYSKALEHVMMKYIVNKTPQVTVAVLHELSRRQGLQQALAGQSGKTLCNILRFLIKNISNVRFGRVIIDVTNILIDVYEDNLTKLEPDQQKLYHILTQKLKEESEIISSLFELQGTLEMLLSASEIPQALPNNFEKLLPSASAQKNLIYNVS